eukprot:COSAG01_NODE_2090_length_8453_cov_554.144721_7_plen_54_part_00
MSPAGAAGHWLEWQSSAYMAELLASSLARPYLVQLYLLNSRYEYYSNHPLEQL